MTDGSFDYNSIPIGFYDSVLHGANPIRRLWHVSKFERVLDFLPSDGGDRSLLDIGCFAGSFLSMVPPERFARQLGIDILRSQIEYARVHHGTPFREFAHVESVRAIGDIEETFDCITLIEVIEHLDAEEGRVLLRQIARKLRPGGRLVLTTPNYASAWPIVEMLVNRFSEVGYSEQHVTKFNYFTFERQLRQIDPAFFDDFAIELKTTTHFLTPFLAGLSYRLAHRLSRIIPHRYWRLPFGNLVLLVASRRTEGATWPAGSAPAREGTGVPLVSRRER